MRIDICQSLLEFLHRAKKERAIDNEHLYIIRQGFRIAALLAFFDLDRFRHLSQKMQGGENDANIDCDHQINQYRQKERNQEQCIIRTRRTAQHIDTALGFTHIPGDLKQNSRQCRQRNIGGKRGCNQQHQSQRNGMDNPGKWAVTALTDIGRGTRNRSRRGKTAE